MKLSVDTDRCAPFTRDAGIDPIGSAGHHHSFLLVEIDLPWPREITEADELVGITEVIETARHEHARLARVLGIVPRDDHDPAQRRIIHYHRPVGAPFGVFEGREMLVDRGAEVATVEAMLAEPELEGSAPVTDRDVLVCTHGSRDVCCGGDGMRLHLAVEGRFPGVRVWRCSHTGGHRYAPTSITFPDGRFWAHLDEHVFTGLVERTLAPAALRGHDRGSSAFDSPFAQAADRELFGRIGWAVDTGRRWLDHESHDGERGTATVVFEAATGARTHVTVTAELAQRYPAMVCGEGADPSGKTFEEYRVVSVDPPA